MSEAPTFTEWSTMVVPTWHFCRVVRDSRNTLLATAPAESAETSTVAQRTVCAVRPWRWRAVARPSTRARFGAKSRHGDKFNQTPYGSGTTFNSIEPCSIELNSFG